ncbi:MAG: hypothetical protein LC117_09335 [Bacteroidia bacterium]|nr:hypothetical protein [Bacteroidia bacterium]MCZ2278115.1 hypothetical protein [Bacteroidia bacterium]
MKAKSFTYLLIFPLSVVFQITNHFNNMDTIWYVVKTYSDVMRSHALRLNDKATLRSS